MPCPDFQTIMLPTLQALASGGDVTSAAMRERVAQIMRLSKEDLEEMVPSGKQPRFNNRVHWAATYLTEAKLVEWVRRGTYRLSQRGREVLASKPERIDIDYLMRFPEFVAWKTGANAAEEATPGEARADAPAATPEEQLEAGYEALKLKVRSHLLDRILGSSPKFFEELVVDLLVKMGYGGSHADAGEALGRSGDGGLDGKIKEDRLGLDAIYLQAKRWAVTRTVGRPDVQAFVGSLEAERARKGVFITTSSFSKEAEDFVNRIEKKIVLIDGKTLTELMFTYGVGVRTKQAYEIKEVDEDYFLEE